MKRSAISGPTREVVERNTDDILDFTAKELSFHGVKGSDNEKISTRSVGMTRSDNEAM
jgi:hypothetical protein